VIESVVDWIVDSPLGTATWVDWLDIAILTALVYRALKVLRGTRAMRSLVGLLVLGAIYIVSGISGLTALHWVLDGLFVYVVLAVLILFQDDIRQVLAAAGGGWLSREKELSKAHVVEEIVQAAFVLAGRKIGALVALERTASLAPFIEGAQRLDAHVSKEILQAVFHPSSPLHDGAVVISGQRVLAAGVFLPLSLTRNLARAYGTRHRAAIGLADVTDALVVVVSEERGTVALVIGGELQPVVDANDLRQKLQEHLGLRETDEAEAITARRGAAPPNTLS
jgi:diadenylate cyclase